MTDEEKAEEYGNTHCCYYRQDFIRTYLDGLAEGRKEGYEQGKNNERELQCGKKNYEKDITRLEKENAELSNSVTELTNTKTELKTKVTELEKQIEKMKKNCLEVMRVQESNLTDTYMAGMYNGMVTVYNSCFLIDNELEKSYCSKNEYNKWELPE